jgi:UDP-N-acetylmuramyl pentapeptide synthase
LDLHLNILKRKVDIAIIEVGMGGRLDATNIITPLVSVITNIGLDHTSFLEILLMPSLLKKQESSNLMYQ